MSRRVVGSAHFGPGAVTLYKGGREVARLPFALETGVAALRATLAKHFGPSATLTGYYPRAAVVVPAVEAARERFCDKPDEVAGRPRSRGCRRERLRARVPRERQRRWS